MIPCSSDLTDDGTSMSTAINSDDYYSCFQVGLLTLRRPIRTLNSPSL